MLLLIVVSAAIHHFASLLKLVSLSFLFSVFCSGFPGCSLAAFLLQALPWPWELRSFIGSRARPPVHCPRVESLLRHKLLQRSHIRCMENIMSVSPPGKRFWQLADVSGLHFQISRVHESNICLCRRRMKQQHKGRHCPSHYLYRNRWRLWSSMLLGGSNLGRAQRYITIESKIL